MSDEQQHDEQITAPGGWCAPIEIPAIRVSPGGVIWLITRSRFVYRRSGWWRPWRVLVESWAINQSAGPTAVSVARFWRRDSAEAMYFRLHDAACRYADLDEIRAMEARRSL